MVYIATVLSPYPWLSAARQHAATTVAPSSSCRERGCCPSTRVPQRAYASAAFAWQTVMKVSALQFHSRPDLQPLKWIITKEPTEEYHEGYYMVYVHESNKVYGWLTRSSAALGARMFLSRLLRSILPRVI